MSNDIHEKLSAVQLAAVRERDLDFGEVESEPSDLIAQDRRDLLSHIDALEAERARPSSDDLRERLGDIATAARNLLAEFKDGSPTAQLVRTVCKGAIDLCAAERARPAAPCDRDALGRMVRDHLDGCIHDGLLPWSLLPEMSREDFRRIGEALHAAGAASRQGEIARLTAELHEARKAYASVKVGRDLCGQLLWETRADLGLATPSDPTDWDDLPEDTKERFRILGAGMFGAMRESHARHVARKFEGEIARLTAAVQSFQRGSGCLDGYTIGEALAKIGASLDRTPTEGIPDAIERLKRSVTTARADGAREEREAILSELRYIREGEGSTFAAGVDEAILSVSARIPAR